VTWHVYPSRHSELYKAGMRSALRYILLALLPPFLVDVIRHIRHPSKEQKPTLLGAPLPKPVLELGGCAATPSVKPCEWEVVPDSDAAWTANSGWRHESIVATQLKKWPSFLKSVEGTHPLGKSHEAAADAAADFPTHNTIMTFGYALARAAKDREKISILDWGGGLGHYYVYARALLPALTLDYTVKDLPGFCAAGANLLPPVKFIANESEALGRSYDFVFASSSLHYARDHYGLLDRLCACANEWLMITRTPFVENCDDFLVVQRPYMYGYMTEYPGWFINRTRLLRFVTARGFVLERQFLVAEQPEVPNAPEQARYFGFLFRHTP
jgi:putative methyltransferase (TIGR04325 family)